MDDLLHHPDPTKDTTNRAIIHFIDAFIEGGIARRNADLERASRPEGSRGPTTAADDGTMTFDGLDE